MKLLILGGTGFLGPHVVDAAVARKHTPTLFNRGRTNPQLFPDLEKLHGDRDPDKDEGLKALKGRQWDAVIDTSGYVPRIARASAELLAPNIKQYLFISTVSVYSDFTKPGVDETSPVGKVDDPKDEKVTGTSYGPLKALCEQAVEASMPPGHAIVVRPGLIVGPGDPTDRFTYWPARIDRGGEVLAPGNPDTPVQFIDVRDLAEFCIKLLEDGHSGTFNALGPEHPLTMAAMLYGCMAVTTSDAKLTWVPTEFVMQQGAAPWSELPVWVPDEGEEKGFARVSNAKGIAMGLKFRPFADTARDTLVWFKKNIPADHKWGAGLSAEKERKILDAWHAEHSQKPTSQP
ncbi:MAG TPA: SDR family oxidoreductase [Tepidisphaeraceae bacterium]|jgi:2'-hydroxyisoflavone reductase